MLIINNISKAEQSSTTILPLQQPSCHSRPHTPQIHLFSSTSSASLSFYCISTHHLSHALITFLTSTPCSWYMAMEAKKYNWNFWVHLLGHSGDQITYVTESLIKHPWHRLHLPYQGIMHITTYQLPTTATYCSSLLSCFLAWLQTFLPHALSPQLVLTALYAHIIYHFPFIIVTSFSYIVLYHHT